MTAAATSRPITMLIGREVAAGVTVGTQLSTLKVTTGAK
ncbi:hypothetical protein FRUB_09268 [Fimbriiglobus ruber]|uniref:Uncharacterized protein n=1 Tax=Fimbriiglobus ruber TaxID=1908690 RepID=A0A225DJY6_9BACT|nr:hypothetical protein FRUB_09268 [Fimbriiglobus ruber]